MVFRKLSQPGQTQHVCFWSCVLFAQTGAAGGTGHSAVNCGVVSPPSLQRYRAASQQLLLQASTRWACRNVRVFGSVVLSQSGQLILGKTFLRQVPSLIAALKSDGYNSESKVSYHETWWGRVVGRVNHMNRQLSNDAIR